MKEKTIATKTDITPLYSAAGIAQRYGVSRRKVIDWYNDGLIPASVHVGRVLRFDPAAVDHALRKATSKKG